MTDTTQARVNTASHHNIKSSLSLTEPCFQIVSLTPNILPKGFSISRHDGLCSFYCQAFPCYVPACMAAMTAINENQQKHLVRLSVRVSVCYPTEWDGKVIQELIMEHVRVLTTTVNITITCWSPARCQGPPQAAVSKHSCYSALSEFHYIDAYDIGHSLSSVHLI